MSDLSEAPALVAEREGLVMVLPGRRSLFIDLDSVDALVQFEKLYQRVREAMSSNAPIERARTTSRNGGTHVYLEFQRDITEIERIAWQAALGSDPMRETLSLLRIELSLQIAPVVFFERPEEVIAHRLWEVASTDNLETTFDDPFGS